MNCKFCQQELEDGITLCPACGKENAEAEPATEVNAEAPAVEEMEQPATETKEAPKPGLGKISLALGILVALLVLLAALLMGGSEPQDAENGDATGDTGITELTEGTEPTEPPTTPADTGLNDATCKGSYTVSDEDLLAGMDTVVATLGEKQMTVADLQVYYWLQVREFLSSEDFYYLYYYYGYVDPTQPLDTQICFYDEALTWQQYFIGTAIDAWKEFTAMAIAAEENGVQMQEELQTDLENMEQSLNETATANGFADVQELLEYNFGPGASMETYAEYLRNYYMGFSYYSQQYEALTPNEEEVNAHFEENQEYFAENGITKEIKTIDVRHVLIQPEGGTVDPTTGLSTYTEEAWAAAEQEAQGLLDAWIAGGATEEAFGEMAKEHTADGNGAEGGLYTGVTEGYMVDEFNDWCFDESRQVGDYGLVKTVFGWHIMYFSGSATNPNENWFGDVQSDLLYTRIENLMDEAINKYEIVVDYSALILGNVELAG